MISVRIPLTIAVVLAMATGGCARWKPLPESVGPLLPTPPLSAETVVLETAFAYFEPTETEQEKIVWDRIDESVIPIELRKRLAENGMRAGRLGPQFPAELRTVLDRSIAAQEKPPGGDDVSDTGASFRAPQRRLHLRKGGRAKITTTSVVPTLSVLSVSADGAVQGNLFNDAQGMIALRGWPEADGSTRIEIVPEVEHGESKNRWTPLEGALVQQVGKERRVYDQLKISMRLAPGEMLLISAGETPGGIGQSFFTQQDPVPRRGLLLIRVAQTQTDELFGRTSASSIADESPISKPTTATNLR